jgi:purine-binding chemotaxis protein CheW
MNTDEIKKLDSYLTFKIGDENFASNVSKIISILELQKITKIPRTPDYIKGVINLRGTVLPIVDLHIKFGLPPTEFTPNTCILVMDLFIDDVSVKVGGLVDSVQEVLEIDEKDILPPPKLGKNYQSEFIEGMFKTDGSFIIILNMDHLFTEDELTTIGSDLLFKEDDQLIEQKE